MRRPRAVLVTMRALALALAIVAAAVGPAGAQDGGRLPVRVETLISPDTLRLGHPVTLTWRIWLPGGSTATFPARPPEDSLHHWTTWVTETREPGGQYREHRLSGSFQTFALGPVSVPGPPVRFRIPGEEPRDGTFPVAQFTVVPTVPLDGPEPPLKDIHDLVPPPWWATWPWLWIAAGAAALALLAWLVWRLRRRKPRAALPVSDLPLDSPEVEAKRRLEALIARHLPEAGRTYEHGSELADLLRRFVERRFAGGVQPGDTTAELTARLLERGDVTQADVTALHAILDACDLTKFARRPYDAPRAHQAEVVAARLIAGWGAPPLDAAAERGAA
ncbi:MAG: DUF4381 family protein [Candidatus Eisenbacteria bacterium]